MDQRKLYRTIESFGAEHHSDENEMLFSILNKIIGMEGINVSGGRLWKLNPEKMVYKLLYQTGNIDEINPDFTLSINDYPIFEEITRQRTILDTETNIILRSKGILRYSATGVGDKIKLNGKQFYEYLVALNTETFDEEQRITLNLIASAITSLVKQRKYSTRAKKLLADLDKAREVQKSILPEHEYRFQNYELFGVTDPAEIVGGDFFDYLAIGDDEDRLGVTVGDAASKGISAAAEALYISGALRMASNFEIKIYPLMKRMNQLVNKIFSDEKFASLFYGELSNDKSGLFLYGNAGHNPPIFIRQSTGQITLLHSTGPVLGPDPNAKYRIENINFEKDDVLLIYSDGVTDSADEEFNDYGEERLTKLFFSLRHLTAKEIVYSILEDVTKFSKNGKYSDDKTILVIKRIK